MSYEVRLQNDYHKIRQRLAGDSGTTVRAIELAERVKNEQEAISRAIEVILKRLTDIEQVSKGTAAKAKALDFRTKTLEKFAGLEAGDAAIGNKIPHYPHIPLSDIIEMVCKSRNIDPALMPAENKTKCISTCRFIIIYLARSFGKKASSIGRLLGDRDHSTIIHAATEIEHRMCEEKGLKEEIESYRQRLLDEAK